MYKQPKVSIIVPYHDMENAEFFLKRNIDSITSQTFKDYEIVLTKDGKMAENTNSGIKRARGEYIKILYLDDYLTDSEALTSLMTHIRATKPEWLICGANDNLNPQWTDNIETGNNKLGSPSALVFKNHFKNNVLFDETMSWLLDADVYKRLSNKYGHPIILPGDYVTIGKGTHQMTHILTDEEKLAEHKYMTKKYE